MNIEGVAIGGNNPCRFIFEVSNAHNGDKDRALRLIDAAAASNADFVKFQCYTPDELVAIRGDGPAPEPWGAMGWTMRALYDVARTPLEWFPDLFAHARTLGLVPFASVFGADSLAVLQAVGCPAYKIARLDNESALLHALVNATGKPKIVSVAPNQTAHADATLFCPPGYPQEPFACTPDIWTAHTGLSYHGTDPAVPMHAVATGAKLIETHVMLDDEPSELEASVCLTVSQFTTLVRGW